MTRLRFRTHHPVDQTDFSNKWGELNLRSTRTYPVSTNFSSSGKLNFASAKQVTFTNWGSYSHPWWNLDEINWRLNITRSEFTYMRSGTPLGRYHYENRLFGGDDIIITRWGDDTLYGYEGNDHLIASGGDDVLFGGTGSDRLEGGRGLDKAIYRGFSGDYEISASGGGYVLKSSTGDIDTLSDIEILQFADISTSPGDLLAGNTLTSDSGAAPASLDPLNLAKLDYQPLPGIKDFGGNLHGGSDSSVSRFYKYQGTVDVNQDGYDDLIYTNDRSGRWATLDSTNDGIPNWFEHGEGGGTRVVGIYQDPLVRRGLVEQGSPHDSQVRFQNDLFSDNLRLGAAADVDEDGFGEVFWKTTDGSAFLRTIHHADGNVKYANYMNGGQVHSYLSWHGYLGDVGASLGL